MTPPRLHLCTSAFILVALLGCGRATDGIGDCQGQALPIHDLQGPGGTSPRVDQQVTVRGVVVGDFQGKDRLEGFFVQDPNADDDPLTSEGLFILGAQGPEVAVGDLVQVTGRVEEPSELTSLNATERVEICRSGVTLQPLAISLSEPVSLKEENLEPYEGMLVIFSDELTVASTHQLGSTGQLLVTPGGRPFHVKRVETTTPAVEARRLIVDDGSRALNPASPPFLDGTGTRRVGDTVQGLTGVISEAEGHHVLLPTTPPRFVNANPRPSAPTPVGGTVRVASFNLLNFFSTLGERGAADANELERQSAKHVATLAALNADIVGLIELENTGDAAIQVLVDALNAAAGDGAWAAVSAPAEGLGEDSIRVGMIYRPAVMSLVGPPVADYDPVFKRPPLAQTFQVRDERFTVVVSHFKSKRCDNAAGADLDAGDGQGCWNALRTRQAHRLVELVDELRSASGDPDVLVLGDLNAYGAEDPIRALTEDSLIDQVASRVPPQQRYSYVYSGTSGYLDHALTTPSLDRRVTGVTFWHINSDEPPFLDYRTDTPAEHYSPDPFRSSDHDPVLIGLAL